MLNKVYTKPRLCKSKDGNWYVHFTYRGKLKKYKKGINYIKNLKEKEIFGNALTKALLDKLKTGWNPFAPEVIETDETLFILDALNYALKEKRPYLAKKTYSSYAGTLRFITKAIKSLGFEYLDIKDVKRVHIRHIVKKAMTQRKWSNKARNKHLNYLSAIFDELLHLDIIEINPCTKIRRFKVEESVANRVPTPKEFYKILNFLKENNYNFYVFVITIYFTGIRPKELLEVQINDFDFNRNEIVLKSKYTKNKKNRRVPINKDLMIHLINIGLITDRLDFYLFGAFNYNHKHRNKKGLDFLVAPIKIKRDTATKLWYKIVKMHLKIDVNLYSIKHKGCDDMLKAGIDLDSIRYLFGHSAKRTTKIYAKEITDIYKNDLLSKYPKIN